MSVFGTTTTAWQRSRLLHSGTRFLVFHQFFRKRVKKDLSIQIILAEAGDPGAKQGIGRQQGRPAGPETIQQAKEVVLFPVGEIPGEIPEGVLQDVDQGRPTQRSSQNQAQSPPVGIGDPGELSPAVAGRDEVDKGPKPANHGVGDPLSVMPAGVEFQAAAHDDPGPGFCHPHASLPALRPVPPGPKRSR